MSKKRELTHYEPIALSGESTVVAEFFPMELGKRATNPKLNWSENSLRNFNRRPMRCELLNKKLQLSL